MKKEIFGIFKAIVTDVSCFKETGKIRTRISFLNNSYVNNNLLFGYEADNFSKSVEKDSFTNIMLPFGGGEDYGMFKLPPVNSVGLVSFIDGNINNPIWIGGISSSYFSPKGELVKLSTPSDNLYLNKSSVSFDADANKSEFNIEDEDSLIIKIKTNKLNNLNKPEEMSWENPIENGVVMNKSKMEFLHAEEETYQTIKLSKDDNYSILIKHSNEDMYSSIEIGNSGVKVETSSSNGSVSSFEANKEDISISFKGEDYETKISQNKDEIRLENDQSLISLKKEDLRDEVIISAPRIRISSQDIVLGNSNYRIVVSPADFNLTLEDGTMLTTAKNVRL
jgi:hypothetical protein